MNTYTTYQLADDAKAYGPDASKFIVTSADYEKEHSGPMSQRDAEAYAAMLTLLEAIVNVADTDPFCSIGHVIEHGVGQDVRAIIAQAEGRVS